MRFLIGLKDKGDAMEHLEAKLNFTSSWRASIFRALNQIIYRMDRLKIQKFFGTREKNPDHISGQYFLNKLWKVMYVA